MDLIGLLECSKLGGRSEKLGSKYLAHKRWSIALIGWLLSKIYSIRANAVRRP